MLRRTFLAALINCAAAVCLFPIGARGFSRNGTKRVSRRGIDWTAIDAEATVRGIVTCDGRGVKDVVVTDGFNMTRTNEQGAYCLRTSSDKSDFVYLTIPSGFEVASKRGFLPDFYRPVAETSVGNVQQFDFELTQVDNNHHIVIVSADMHIKNVSMIESRTEDTPDICPPAGEIDSVTFRKHYSANLRNYLASLPAGVPVYGINLGDMTNDYTYWKKGGTFENYINIQEEEGMTVQTFHVIGNHDHDQRVKDIPDDDDSASEREYMAAFGPTYYSFNIGRVHYVVLDNIKYVNNGGKLGYKAYLTPRQMDWIRKDAEYMASNVERIVICEHQASYLNNESLDAQKKVANAEEMLDVYAAKGVPITILDGHHHVAQTVLVPRSDVDVVEYVHPAVTGAWWYFPLCSDGAPSTFTRYEFNGGDLTKRRSYNFTCPEEQYYRLYNKGLKNDDGEPVIRLNVWDYGLRWRFECRENGGLVDSSRLKRISMKDPYFKKVRENTGNNVEKRRWLNVINTFHAFEYTPVNPAADIQVTAWDEFGDRLFVIDTKIETEI